MTKFTINRVTGWRNRNAPPCENAVKSEDGEWVIDLTSLEELLALRDHLDEDLVLYLGNKITIYDDYLE